jgi:methyl-accepting chemotaxis protein
MKLSVGQRILIGIGTVEVLALGLGLFVLYKMVRLREVEATIRERDVATLDRLAEVAQTQRDMLLTRERTVTAYLQQKSPPPAGARALKIDPVRSREEYNKGHETMSAALRSLREVAMKDSRTALSPARQQKWEAVARSAEEVEEARRGLAEASVALFDALAKEQHEQIAGPLRDILERRRVFEQKLKDGTDQTRDLMTAGAELSAETYRSAWTSSAVGLVLMLALGLAAGLMIQRSVTGPLAQFVIFAEQVGKGDLTVKAPPTGVTELQRLGESLDLMVGGLKGLAGQIAGATQDLNAASREILASVQETAAGTREQSASVQEITATVEEVSQSGGQISERARQVATAAEAAASTTAVGLRAVEAATRAMGGIREQVEAFAEHVVALTEKTQAVGEIVSAVTDVAERSNLLALNAAIEAAGAGEHGTRFAVVAGEMKNLADQAKESTVQVQSILGGIQKGINSSVMLTEEAVKRSEAGREQAETTERVIREMADTMQQSVHAFQQIIAATNQQQIGLEQITQGMRDVRQAASQTATATSQLELAVTNITGLSRALQEAVGRYRL